MRTFYEEQIQDSEMEGAPLAPGPAIMVKVLSVIILKIVSYLAFT